MLPTRILMILCSMLLISCRTTSPTKNNSDLDGTLVREDKTPPKILFHYGEYKYLSAYGDREGTFTQAEWQKIPSNTNGQDPYRRGLYVSQHIGMNERYGASANYSNEGVWAAVIHISDICRDDHSSSYIEPALTKSPEFKSFVASTEYDNIRNSEACTTSSSSFECQTLLAKYYDLHGIWIVFDSWWQGYGFWYIQKRECIESLYTSPQKILQEIADLPEAWSRVPFTDISQQRNGDGSTLVVLVARAMGLVKDLDKGVLEKLYTSTKASDIPGVRDDFSKVVAAAVTCAKNSKNQLIQQPLQKFDAATRTKSPSELWSLIKKLGTDAEEINVACWNQ